MDNRYFDCTDIKGQYQRAVAKETAVVLQEFCESEPEFAQAVEQSGRTYQECLDEAVKGIGKSISDEEFYNKAVQFYFPTASVKLRPKLYMSDYDKEDNEPSDDMFGSLLDF